jgi:predicted RNase H-like HicB family nuclease
MGNCDRFPISVWQKAISKYELVIYWSEADGAFIVEVSELPGCMADGCSYQEAVMNAEQIIQEWLETAKEEGRPIPTAKGRLIYA